MTLLAGKTGPFRGFNRFLHVLKHSRLHRRYWGTVLCIALAGLILRCIHVYWMHFSPVSDMLVYLALSDTFILKKEVLQHERDFSIFFPPAYPIVLGIVRLWFGLQNFRPLLYVQAFMDSSAIICVAYIARHLFNARTGVIAALIYCIYRIAILNTGVLMSEAITTVLCIYAVCAFLSYYRAPGAAKAVLIGALLGVAGHFRTNVLSLVGVFCLYSVLRGMRWPYFPSRRKWVPDVTFRISVLHPTLIVLAMLFVMVPWTVRNTRVAGRFVPHVEHGAWVMILGNNPFTHGEYIPLENMPASWSDQWKGLERAEAIPVYSRLLSEYMFQTHTAYNFLSLLPLKVHALLSNDGGFWPWTHVKGGTAADMPLGPRLRVWFVDYWLIGTLGGIGLFFSGRAPRWLCGVLWLALFLPVLSAFPTIRYRYMSDFVLVVSAAHVAQRLFFTQNFKRRFTGLVAGIAGVSLAWTALAHVRLAGSNLLETANGALKNPMLEQAVNGTYISERQVNSGSQPEVRWLGTVPVDGGLAPHLAVTYDFRAERPESLKGKYGPWQKAWPEMEMRAYFYDDQGATITTALSPAPLNFATLGPFQENGGRHWRVVPVPGYAKSMGIMLIHIYHGKLELSRFEARGPIWGGTP